MYTRPPNLYFHTTKLLLLGMFLCIFTAGTALADPPADKPCKGSKCDTPLPASADNYVFWGYDEDLSAFFERIPSDSDPRTCSLTQVAADFSSGTYTCTLNHYYVTYAFSGNIESCEAIYFKKENDWYCDPDRDGWINKVPDLEYTYSWTGNCLTGCDVTIVNRINMATMSSPLYGSITIEAFASGVTTEDDDPNPFSEAQDIPIDYVHVTKFSPKNNKILAICRANPIPGRITFHTSLSPVIPE